MQARWCLLAAVVCTACATVDAANAANATAHAGNGTACTDWSRKTMLEYEKMLVKAAPSTADTADLQGFQTHHTQQLRWAEAHADTAKKTELTTGPCGAFNTRVEAKLAIVNGGFRRGAAHSVAALMSLIALAHISAAY